jgi:amino acid transporter
MARKELFRRKTIHDILTHAGDLHGEDTGMKKNLGVRDLTGFGIAAIIGAGIFSTIGGAAASGGPAVSLLFVFTAIACGFSAMCYAQFASSIPISGSAYTYAYASFGELIAWIIGWDLIMEYAVGNIAVAISWSDYFTGFCGGFGFHIPEFLSIDYLSAYRGYQQALTAIHDSGSVNAIPAALQEAFYAWKDAPTFMGIRFIADIPAFTIVVFITYLVYKGIYESKMASNIMVLLKVLILLVVIAVGSFYVNPSNWSPFAPNGITGVLKGVAGVFFAYIGFDAISTTAEECRNPRRDLPRSIIYALVITTVLYIVISLVLTGMVHYSELGVGDPLAYVFEKLHLTRLSGVIAFSAIIAMASVLLVFQVGQPRIWMSMSRDGLLPGIFSRLHKKYRTPAFSTLLTGVVVAIPSLFLSLKEVTDLTSIGTLFAFVLVSGGVLILDGKKRSATEVPHQGFRIPYINSRFILPVLWLIVLFLIFRLNYDGISRFFNPEHSFETTWTDENAIWHKFPMYLFILIASCISLLAIIRELSLIPVLGLLTNLYLMTELGISNWLRFLIWLVLGLVIYFFYGYHHSRLNKPAA